METLQILFWFLILIGVMILLHELGHYLAARLFDVKVEAFSLGFGPRLTGFQSGETDFRICAIPMGGYVKMTGEQPGEPGSDDPRAFPNKPRWQQLIVVFAGPFVNMILAVAILTGLYMFQYERVPNPENPVVGWVAPNGVAAAAGIEPGDRVIEFDGEKNPTWEDISFDEPVSAGRAIQVELERDGQTRTVSVTPKYDEQIKVGVLGWGPEAEVQISDFCCGIDAAKNAGLKPGDVFVSVNGEKILTANRLLDILKNSMGQPLDIVYRRDGAEHETTATPVRGEVEGDTSGEERWLMGVGLQQRVETVQLNFAEALRESVNRNLQYAGMLYQFIEGMVEQRLSPTSLEGPIGIARLSGEAAQKGATTYLGLMAYVSLNLAVVNLLPIPLLDGGTILILLIEMLMRRGLDMRVKEAVVKLGFVFLMMMIVFVIYNDISKVMPSGSSPDATQQVETQ